MIREIRKNNGESINTPAQELEILILYRENLIKNYNANNFDVDSALPILEMILRMNAEIRVLSRIARHSTT